MRLLFACYFPLTNIRTLSKFWPPISGHTKTILSLSLWVNSKLTSKKVGARNTRSPIRTEAERAAGQLIVVAAALVIQVTINLLAGCWWRRAIGGAAVFRGGFPN